MKTAITIIISILSLVSYGQNSLQDLKNDELINQFFEESDFNSLLLILNSYDNFVKKATGLNNIDSAYHTFSEYVRYNKIIDQVYFKTRLPENLQDSIILSFEKSGTFRKIWNLEFSKRRNQIDTLNIYLEPNMGWSYGQFLKELSKTNGILKSYIESIYSCNCISPTSLLTPALIHDKLDFEKLHWRLYYGIHFITINYNVKYHKINR